MNKNPSSLYTVRFGDCDPFGHLNNARYVDYFINAREDHLKESYSIHISDFAPQGISWLVGKHEISFLRPASYSEIVFITSSVIQATTEGLLVEMVMLDEKQTHLKALMWTKFIPVNIKTGKKEQHPESFMEFAKSIERTDIDINEGYQKRLTDLVIEIRSARQ
jgi:YbgC/YbaW family acyl-CoA thioester hydrolase